MHFDSAVPTDPEAIAAGGLLNWLSSTDKQFDVKSRIMQVRHWPVSTCGAALARFHVWCGTVCALGAKSHVCPEIGAELTHLRVVAASLCPR